MHENVWCLEFLQNKPVGRRDTNEIRFTELIIVEARRGDMEVYYTILFLFKSFHNEEIKQLFHIRTSRDGE